MLLLRTIDSFANAYYEDWEKEVRATKQRATHLMKNYANKCQAHGVSIERNQKVHQR